MDSPDGKQIHLNSVTNVYHGSPCDGPDENVYDVIPDYIIANRQVRLLMLKFNWRKVRQ